MNGWRVGGWIVKISLYRKVKGGVAMCKHLLLYITKAKSTLHPPTLHP